MNAAQPQKRLAQWYQSTAGQNLLGLENTMLNKGIESLFGYHLLMLGALDYAQGIAGSPIAHKVLMNDECLQAGAVDLLGSQHDLPFRKDSIDVVVMPHLLEFSQHPHHILREVERIVMPDGYLVILGFNPVSCYGLCRVLLGFQKHMPWQGHYYHPVRLRDWIHLLGFKIVEISYCGFTPPIPHGTTQQRLAFMEKAADSFLSPLGSVYMIVAQNQTITPSVIRPAWKRQRAKPIENGVAEPTARQGNRH
jgi:SAM-dependent methyltransferase